MMIIFLAPAQLWVNTQPDTKSVSGWCQRTPITKFS